VNSRDPNHAISNWTYGADPGRATPWNIDESGEMSSEGKAIAASIPRKNAGSNNVQKWRIESGRYSVGSHRWRTRNLAKNSGVSSRRRNIRSQELLDNGSNLLSKVCPKEIAE
jgi:hypothetical protein